MMDSSIQPIRNLVILAALCCCHYAQATHQAFVLEIDPATSNGSSSGGFIGGTSYFDLSGQIIANISADGIDFDNIDATSTLTGGDQFPVGLVLPLSDNYFIFTSGPASYDGLNFSVSVTDVFSTDEYSGTFDGAQLSMTISSIPGPFTADGTTVNVVINAAVIPDARLADITGIWPDHGDPGTMIFVFGSGFIPAETSVNVNGIQADLVHVQSEDMLIFQLPVGDTAGPIEVTTPFGSVTGADFGMAPTDALSISGFWPGIVTTDTVFGAFAFVFGTGFDKAGTQTWFNGLQAGTQILDQSLLLFIVPPDSVTGPVTITNSSGESVTTTRDLVVQ